MFVVVRERRIEQAAAEDAGADEIPERGADDVGVSKLIVERPVCANELILLDRLDDQPRL